MLIPITLVGICESVNPRWTFDIATLPCSGKNLFLGMIESKHYELAGIIKQGVFKNRQDFSQLQADGTLLFENFGDYGVNSGYLNKTTL